MSDDTIDLPGVSLVDFYRSAGVPMDGPCPCGRVHIDDDLIKAASDRFGAPADTGDCLGRLLDAAHEHFIAAVTIAAYASADKTCSIDLEKWQRMIGDTLSAALSRFQMYEQQKGRVT